MSAPEPLTWLSVCPAGIAEIASRRGRAAEFERAAGASGLRLPALGCVSAAPDRFLIGVRPGRWLMLASPASPGAVAAHWHGVFEGAGIAVDVSAALSVSFLGGPAAREVLTRICRLDIDAACFPPGRAAATLMLQVPATLIALTSGMLLLTPSTTARHFFAALAHIAAPFGLQQRSSLLIASLHGDLSP